MHLKIHRKMFRFLPLNFQNLYSCSAAVVPRGFSSSNPLGAECTECLPQWKAHVCVAYLYGVGRFTVPGSIGMKTSTSPLHSKSSSHTFLRFFSEPRKYDHDAMTVRITWMCCVWPSLLISQMFTRLLKSTLLTRKTGNTRLCFLSFPPWQNKQKTTRFCIYR